MEPVNDDLSKGELLARTVYYTSQYSNRNGLKRNYLYPNYKKESRDFPGYHRCRVSLQRLCYGKWNGIVQYAENLKTDSQSLVGFSIAKTDVVLKHGFQLEPAAHERNPFHAHVYIKELDLPYPSSEEVLNSVMNSGVRRRIDEMTQEFELIKSEYISAAISRHYSELCLSCLSLTDTSSST